MSMIPAASEEQKTVIQAMRDGNAVVDSVAGSGKTTTFLHIAAEFAAERVLLMTYSARLKKETRGKVERFGFKNAVVHSYHSFGCAFLAPGCFDDDGLERAAAPDLPPMRPIAFDIMVLDECQDMKQLYFRVVCKAIRNCPAPPRLCVLGDEKQNIYQFRGADSRYITMAPRIFAFANSLPWREVRLSESYRLTAPMAEFINTCMLGGAKRIVARKAGAKVRYAICDISTQRGGQGEKSALYRTFAAAAEGYAPGDIFVLAPSVRRQTTADKKYSTASPVVGLSNAISDFHTHSAPGGAVKYKTHIYVPQADDDMLDGDVIAHKVVFASFHQAKGLERPLVFIVGLDESYYKFYGKTEIREKCPNAWYVACTRASEKLVIIHGAARNKTTRPASFVDFDKIAAICDMNNPGYMFAHSMLEDGSAKCSVTQLTKSVAEKLGRADTETMLGLFAPMVGHIPAPTVVVVDTKTWEYKNEGGGAEFVMHGADGDKYCEGVSEITGTAIPMYYAYRSQGKFPADVAAALKDELLAARPELPLARALKQFEECAATPGAIEHMLRIAALMCAARSGARFKVSQIKKYDWISAAAMEECMRRIGRHISAAAIYESVKSVDVCIGRANLRIVGTIDCIDRGVIWEFKCVRALSPAHFAQAIVYAYMARRLLEKQNAQDLAAFAARKDMAGALECMRRAAVPPRCRLYNIYNDEIFELRATDAEIRLVVSCIVGKYFEEEKPTTDDEFAAQCAAAAAAEPGAPGPDDDDAAYTAPEPMIAMFRGRTAPGAEGEGECGCECEFYNSDMSPGAARQIDEYPYIIIHGGCAAHTGAAAPQRKSGTYAAFINGGATALDAHFDMFWDAICT